MDQVICLNQIYTIKRYFRAANPIHLQEYLLGFYGGKGELASGSARNFCHPYVEIAALRPHSIPKVLLN